MRRFVSRVWRAGAAGLAGVALALGLCGCRVLLGPEEVEQSAEDAKPWNQPAAWEGRSLGIPY